MHQSIPSPFHVNFNNANQLRLEPDDLIIPQFAVITVAVASYSY